MSGENILVVDDEPIIGTAFERELEDKGCNVDSVLSGEEALKTIRSKKYDIAFIDMVMPGMNGIEACKKLKETSPDTILIFMTGRVDKDVIYKELDFQRAGGKVYFLYKPFLKDEIYEVIEMALAEKAKKEINLTIK
ncbi:MAG: hypothetical protein COV46_05940 [Deltaproteobacteria bacterium CG11_big_fil_rev_8_21_14_0_20_49_13]|nr:MAG: hypothetical protein COV46_05940 [Deltaproteobacteria bacterium CG11_big_fil_rev_8_21_14_0_20_49_13]